MRLPPKRAERSSTVTWRVRPFSRARPIAAYAADSPAMPPPMTTMRRGSATGLPGRAVQQGTRELRKDGHEIVVIVEGGHARRLQAAVPRERGGLEVEVVEDLDVIGEKADGRQHDVLHATRARL